VEKHGSQKDYSSGFGGKFGVQADRQDKSAVGWDYVEKLQKHESQKGMILYYLKKKNHFYYIFMITRLCCWFWRKIWCAVRSSR